MVRHVLIVGAQEEKQAWETLTRPINRQDLLTLTPVQIMEAASSSSKSKHKRSHDKDRESSSRKRAKHKHHSKKSSKKNEDHLHVVDDDVGDEDMWVEKNVDMDGEKVLSDGLLSLFANYKT